MALWGNSDRIGAGGTVQLGDGTNLWATNDDGHYYVTGTATSFGSVGAAKTGDLIRFGTRGGGSTFFGDAVVVGIASTEQLTIASTEGLSGADIDGVDFYVNEGPVYTVLDPSYSFDTDVNADAASYNTLIVGTALTSASIGSSCVAVYAGKARHHAGKRSVSPPVQINDVVYINSTEVPINNVGVATFQVGAAETSGTTYVSLNQNPSGAHISGNGNEPAHFFHATAAPNGIKITAVDPGPAPNGIGTARLVLESGLAGAVTAGQACYVKCANIIGLGVTISAGVGTDDAVTFQRLSGGLDKVLYAVGSGTLSDTSQVGSGQTVIGSAGIRVGAAYTFTDAGWVGVTTYIDSSGSLRVKKEVLVAMSGINTVGTGNSLGINFPTPASAAS